MLYQGHKEERRHLETYNNHHLYVIPDTNGGTSLGQATQLYARSTRKSCTKRTLNPRQYKFPNQNCETPTIVRKSKDDYENCDLPRYYSHNFRPSESKVTSNKNEAYPDYNFEKDEYYTSLKRQLDLGNASVHSSVHSESTAQPEAANHTSPITSSHQMKWSKGVLIPNFERFIYVSKETILPDRQQFLFETTAPPRVPEVPRLLTPELDPIYEPHGHFCPCCDGYRDGQLELDLNGSTRKSKMDAQCELILHFACEFITESGRSKRRKVVYSEHDRTAWALSV